jgi:hypothetical protein
MKTFYSLPNGDNGACSFKDVRDALSRSALQNDGEIAETPVQAVTWYEMDDEIMLVLPDGTSYTIRDA